MTGASLERGEWGVGNGEWGKGSYFPTLHSLLPTPFCLFAQNTSQIYAAAAALCREEGFEHAGEGREVARLDQNFARPGEFGDDAFAAQEAAEPAGGRGFAQFVSHMALPGHEMARVDDVPLAVVEPLAMDRAE